MKHTQLFNLIALCMALIAITAPAGAQVAGSPAFVDYQGTVFDGVTGDPLGSTGTAPDFTANPTNYTMEFRIYDQQEAGVLIWAETQTVTVSLGNFSVRLGAGVPIPNLSPAPTQSSIANAFNDKDRYLELTVVIPPAASGTPITPRLAFQSSPFSFVAQRAKLADEVVGAVTATNLSGSTGSFSGNVSAESFSGHGTIPIGGIIMWSGAIDQIPTGWALCDGANDTPDLRGRFVAGAGGAYSVDETGGADAVALTANQMPAHSHSASTNSDGRHNHLNNRRYRVASGTSAFVILGIDSLPDGQRTDSGTIYGDGSEHNHTITVSSTGGNEAHENRPPYYALAYIMRVE